MYRRLRDLAFELADELDAAIEAQKSFDTGAAKKVLDKIIEVIGDVAMEISRHYSSSKTSKRL